MTRKREAARDLLSADSSSAWSRSSERRSPRLGSSDDGSQAQVQPLKKLTPGLSLKGRALAHLARREHSRAELHRKLGPHAESEDEVERALDDLAARGFLSDARVVESVLHQRSSRMGTVRLRQELQRKGISSELSTPALAALSGSEADRAWSLWLGKFGHRLSRQADGATAHDSDIESLSPSERRDKLAAERLTIQKERGKQQRFLLSRGFSAAVVNATLRRAALTDPDAANTCDDTEASGVEDPFTD